MADSVDERITPVQHSRVMAWPASHGGRALVVALAVAASTACLRDSDDVEATPQSAELAALVEDGLAEQLPPPLLLEEREFYGDKLDRRGVAESLRERTAAVVAPIALAASIFAVEGAADLVLAVVPAHKLGQAAHTARAAIKLRRKNKRAPKLAEMFTRFAGELDPDARSVLFLAQKLGRAQRRALKTIYKHTGSEALIHALMRQHIEHTADVRWIARKLKQGELRRDFVRRFTFDGDLVKDIDSYDAHIPWRTLQRVIEGDPVPDHARSALFRKLRGLLGERAAADIVRRRAFAAKYTGREAELAVERGASYNRGTGSLDVVAVGDLQEAVFVEVKNWAAGTWSNAAKRKAILAQLARHNRGVTEIEGRMSRYAAARVLMVAREGYFEGMNSATRIDFEERLTGLGWKIDFIPSKHIPSGASFIDDIR